MKNFDGSLDVDIAAVVGNYDTLKSLTEKFDIPYHCVSHEGLNREEHEQKMLDASISTMRTIWSWLSTCAY